MKFLSLIVMLLSASSYAQAADLQCSRGELGEDNYMQISVSRARNGGVEFNLHETSFSASRTDFARSGSSFAVLNKELKGFAEGDAFSAKVNALLVYSPEARTMNVTLMLDGMVVAAAEEWACK